MYKYLSVSKLPRKTLSDQSFLGPSKSKILRLLRAENSTAGDIASSLHIQVSAARKHLEQLASLDFVTESFQKGEVGRPKKFYALTENGKELFPRTYDTLLDKVVAKLIVRESPRQAESLLRSIAVDVAKSLDSQDLQSGDHVKNVQTSINQLGFEATLNQENGNLTVISRNCPVWKVALKHGEVVCRGYHAELLKAAVKGKNIDRKEWMVDGDSFCRHIITEMPKESKIL